ncbi:glycosyltransferase [Geothrix oryzisoli]|uniref:glycosyltransferase n=1 Tax=Geothrix oryzisoli TaxID=2922721 RepID=UPI0030846E2D
MAIVGPAPFPEGGAAAQRILGIALSLREVGFEVLIGAGQLPGPGALEKFLHQDFQVHSLGERTSEHLPIWLKHLSYIGMGVRTLTWLQGLSPAPRAVILYSGYSPFLLRLTPWCRSRNIPLIFDAVEWYDPANMPGGRYSFYRLNISLAMNWLAPRTGNTIVISRFLEDYFHQRGCRTVRVPPTVDIAKFVPREPMGKPGPLRIGYAGSPGNKDLLDVILEAVLRLDPAGDLIHLDVIGLAPHEVLAYPSLRARQIAALPLNIEAHGRVSHEDALALVRVLDFTVLLRPPLRYAQAGYPTKVVESMALGVPPICNITSDLGEVIHDGVQGIVCEGFDVEALVSTFRRALGMTQSGLDQMRVNARRMAETTFDYRIYSRPLSDLILGSS